MEHEEVDPGVDSEIDDEEIWYTDDPVADPKIDWFYKLRSFAPIAIVLLVTTIYLPNTVGGKISLNSNSAKFEFGQGVVKTQYCGVSASISVNLYSTFRNASPGDLYLNKVAVSGIPAGCTNTTFNLQFYDDTSSLPLEIENGLSSLNFTNSSLAYPCGTSLPTFDSKTVSSKTDFNFNFSNSTLLSKKISKFTMQSSGNVSSLKSWPSPSVVTPPLVNIGDTFTFSSDTDTGRDGPTFSSLKTKYIATPWTQNSTYFNMTTDGYQKFTVCLPGRYEISAKGASGGTPNTYASGGGQGAIATGVFDLYEGQTLTIVVGKRGGNGTANCPGYCASGGGGGGSFVFDQTSISLASILVAAGGGAGWSSLPYDTSTATLNASLTSFGNDGSAAASCTQSKLLGGSNGSGGIGLHTSGNERGQNGGAGGGILTSGTMGPSYSGDHQGGHSIVSDAKGAQSGYTNGGFGGGGGGGDGLYNGGGGGGGYSGGGGSKPYVNTTNYPACAVAGGGGSSVASTSSLSSIVLGNTSTGSVTIKRIS